MRCSEKSSWYEDSAMRECQMLVSVFAIFRTYEVQKSSGKNVHSCLSVFS